MNKKNDFFKMNINIYQLTLTYLKTDKMRFPYFKGNLIRGILGNALKDIYCIYEKNTNCSKCEKKYECKFANYFQGIINKNIRLPEKYKKFTNFPSMFVIDDVYDEDNFLKIKINLIGDIKKHFDLLLKMFINVKKFKPDKYSRGRLILFSIKNNEKYIYLEDELLTDFFEKANLIGINKPNITLNFLSPTRITLNGKLVMDDLNSETLIKKIYERANLLMYLYSDIKEIPKISKDALIIKDKQLRWSDVKHNSNRQKEKIKLGGFLGTIDIEIKDENIKEFLQIAQKMHIGANAKAGYGKFEIL